MTDFDDTEKEITHPLEKALGIESGTTVTTQQTVVPGEIVVPVDYDDKDSEIEEQLQEIYEMALEEFENQSGRVVEGRFAARNGEVASMFLNAALNAVKEKASIKAHKDKLTTKAVPKSLTQNLTQNVVADRNDLIDMMNKKKDS